MLTNRIIAASEFDGTYPIAILITTSPPGLTVTVDDSVYTGPQTFNWAAHSSHVIAVESPQSGKSFVSWSDGGAQTHTVRPIKDTTYTATFV